MTRCKLHPYEPGVGVCASCLRERLLALIDAQSDLSPDHHRRCRCHSRLKPDAPAPHPPPLLFPRSVSPYVSHRRSLGSDAPSVPRRRRHLLFYSTPQVGPAAVANAYPSSDRPRRRDRFSLLKSLFGNPRSAEAEPDPGGSKRSWLSALLRGRRRRKPSPPAEALPCYADDCGMSPAIDDFSEESVSESGYSTESSSGGWRLPVPTPMRRAPAQHRHHPGRGVSGFAVCLSPLVRAAPRRCQAADAGFSGELLNHQHQHQHQPRRQASFGAATLGPNRSRKLADVGRFR